MSKTQAEWPQRVTRVDHLKHTHTHDCKNQQELDAHLAAGWTKEYVYQKFPMAVHHAKGHTRSVANETELEAALAEGFSEKPVEPDAEEGK